MLRFLSAVVLSLLVLWVDAGFRSCKDVYLELPGTPSGVFELYNPEGEVFSAYCDFYNDYGYTYITNATLYHMDLHHLYTDRSHVMVRILKTDGTQREVKMEQLSSHQNNHLLTFLYDTAEGFKSPLNTDMAPYLYLGFLPESVAASNTIQGYSAEGQDFTFSNCDADPNSYLAFFFNPNNAAEVNYCPQCNNAFMNGWIQQSQNVAAGRTMPDDYYFQFEMHMGGCGGYISTHSVTDVRGAALGLRFDACPLGFQRHGTNCFRLLPTTATWGKASQLCESLGGTLATIHDSSEQSFVSTLIAGSTDPLSSSVARVWLSGTDMLEQGTWYWTEPLEPVMYNNYASGSPSSTGRCLAMRTSDSKWVDVNCNTKGLYPLCEIHLEHTT